MTTHELADHLSAAARKFPLLGDITAQHLLELIKWELGHEGILDDFQPYAGRHAMAQGPGTILHILSGNTPHAGLQSLLRGLLLKSHNLCKLPSSGLPEIAQFRDALPDAIKSRIEISDELPPHWMEWSDAVIVFGNDKTIAHFRALVRPDQIYIAHGHKVSLGIVFEDPDYSSVPHAARDASLFDQQGCLSPHLFYIRESGTFTAEKYAARLAQEMEVFNKTTPRSKLAAEDAAAIASLRDDYEFRAANGEPVHIWKSTHSTDWTVVYDSEPHFKASPLNRVIFVKPLPAGMEKDLQAIRPHLSTIGIWPATLDNAQLARTTGATRICPVGRMQNPSFAWHQDGGQNLAPLVRWIDFEV